MVPLLNTPLNAIGIRSYLPRWLNSGQWILHVFRKIVRFSYKCRFSHDVFLYHKMPNVDNYSYSYTKLDLDCEDFNLLHFIFQITTIHLSHQSPLTQMYRGDTTTSWNYGLGFESRVGLNIFIGFFLRNSH